MFLVCPQDVDQSLPQDKKTVMSECVLMVVILRYSLVSWITSVADIPFLLKCFTSTLHNCNFWAGANKTLVYSCIFISLLIFFIQPLTLPAILKWLLWVPLPQVILNVILITLAGNLWGKEDAGLLSGIFTAACWHCLGSTIYTAGSERHDRGLGLCDLEEEKLLRLQQYQ